MKKIPLFDFSSEEHYQRPMATRLFLLTFAILSTLPSTASAQYKNKAFGLDIGYWMLTKPTVLDGSGGIINPASNRPNRLANGLRFGGETLLKLDHDNVWFVGRVNLAFLQYSVNSSATDIERDFDQAAKESVGTVFGIQGQLGIRYLFLTDNFRPYIQGGMSFMYLLTFSSESDGDCTIFLCNGIGTNEDNFLPHQAVGAFHLEPGVEVIMSRDFAIRIYADIQRWIVFNATDNYGVVLGLGLLWFT